MEITCSTAIPRVSVAADALPKLALSESMIELGVVLVGIFIVAVMRTEAGTTVTVTSDGPTPAADAKRACNWLVSM